MGVRTAREALAATYTTPEPSPDTADGPQCLRYVWLCYGAVQSNLPPLASVAFAKQGWIYSKMQHPGDRHPPAGAPVYFSGSDGHIAIATGNGDQVRSTEWPWGHVGTTSISAIEQAWGRTYYGWTGDILGHPITFDATTTAGVDGSTQLPATPQPQNQGDESVKYIWSQNRGGALVGELGFYAEGPYAEEALATFGGVTLNDAQFDKARQDAIDRGKKNISAIATQVASMVSGQTIDSAALSKSIAASILAALPAGASPAALPAAVAAAVDAALADNFAAVPAAVLNAEAKRLQA
jgi:hypothetical protein